jgi:hypothetical protein
MNTNGLIYFSAAEFYGHSGRIILKRVGNTDAKICRQIFLQAYFKGKQANALVPYYKGR